MSSLERYFQPNFAFAVILALAAFQYAILAIYMFGGSPDYVLGGDFVAFWSAARETLNGDMAGLYASDGLANAIAAHRPEAVVEGLTWQYPPHASLIFARLVCCHSRWLLCSGPGWALQRSRWCSVQAACADVP